MHNYYRYIFLIIYLIQKFIALRALFLLVIIFEILHKIPYQSHGYILNRYSKKPKFVVKPKFQEVEEGQEVIIDSEIVGDPLPKITWLRDGLKVRLIIYYNLQYLL